MTLAVGVCFVLSLVCGAYSLTGLQDSGDKPKVLSRHLTAPPKGGIFARQRQKQRAEAANASISLHSPTVAGGAAADVYEPRYPKRITSDELDLLFGEEYGERVVEANISPFSPITPLDARLYSEAVQYGGGSV